MTEVESIRDLFIMRNMEKEKEKLEKDKELYNKELKDIKKLLNNEDILYRIKQELIEYGKVTIIIKGLNHAQYSENPYLKDGGEDEVFKDIKKYWNARDVTVFFDIFTHCNIGMIVKDLSQLDNSLAHYDNIIDLYLQTSE